MANFIIFSALNTFLIPQISVCKPAHESILCKRLWMFGVFFVFFSFDMDGYMRCFLQSISERTKETTWLCSVLFASASNVIAIRKSDTVRSNVVVRSISQSRAWGCAKSRKTVSKCTRCGSIPSSSMNATDVRFCPRFILTVCCPSCMQTLALSKLPEVNRFLVPPAPIQPKWLLWLVFYTLADGTLWSSLSHRLKDWMMSCTSQCF